MTATEQLALYRSRHIIRPTFRADDVVHGLDGTYPRAYCMDDGLRIHRRRSKGRDLWLHDSDEIKRLVRASQRV